MFNHFHLLCEVPEPKAFSEAELLLRIEAGYGPARRQALEQELARVRQEPDGTEQIQRLLQPTALGCSDTLWVFRDLGVQPIG
jgi:hypothetical protein